MKTKSDVIKRVSERLSALSDEEFFAEMEKHKDGDISKILIETGAADIISEDMKRERK